ncbi:hypothetical protein D2Q93_14825 [Alicyclobacillaceae bacterium I2511]|nr:hypothetical protein D2Q93_14825 [Alicyclobacillaceae bacterium I2511]
MNGSLTVTFSSALSTAPTVSDFTVTQSVNGGTATAVTPTAVTMNSGMTVATLTLPSVAATSASQSVVYGVSYDGGTSVQSAAFTVGIPELQTTTYSGNTITLTYNQPLNTNSVPAATDFTLLQNGTAIPLLSYVQITGDTVVLTAPSPLISSDTYLLSYTPGTNPVETTSDSPAASFTLQSLTEAAVTPITDLAASFTGGTATVTFTPSLDSRVSTYVLQVSINGGPWVTASSQTSSQTSSPFTYQASNGQSISFQVLEEGTSGTVLATSNATTPVTVNTIAPTLTSATVNGSTVTLQFSQSLSLASGASLSGVASDITVAYAAPSSITSAILTSAYSGMSTTGSLTVSSATVSGDEVVLTLASPVWSLDTVTATYSATSSGTLLDAAGNSLASFSAQSVANATSVNTATVSALSSVSAGQHDGVIYAPYELTLAGENGVSSQIQLVPSDIASISETYNGTTTNLTPVSGDPDLWFNVMHSPGTYTFKVVDEFGAAYQATFDWAGVQSGTATVSTDSSSGTTFNLMNTANTSASATYVGVLEPGTTPSALDLVGGSPTSGAAITGTPSTATFATSGLTSGTYTMVWEQGSGSSATWYNATVNYPNATVPTVSSTSISSDTSASATLALTYNESLASTVTSSDFTVDVNGSAVSVSSAAVSGNTVDLTLGSGILAGQTLTVTYSGTDLQALNGETAADFSNQSVTNTVTAPTLAAAYVNSSTVSLQYSLFSGASFSSATSGDASDFTVTVNGAPDAVSSVSVSGTVINLGLTAAVPSGATAVVTYKGGTTPVEDSIGNPLPSMTNQPLIVE